MMVLEAKASRQYSQDVQARELAASAIDYVAALLGDPEDELSANLWHNSAAFSNIQLVSSTQLEGQGWFTVIAPLESDAAGATVRFGLMNESAKLNLNAIVNSDLDETQQQMRLLAIPGMTEDIADAILDWIDSDDEPRLFGAESETYLGLSPPYSAANGPLSSIDELLLVYGVTPELLYGEDANRNGLLDPNENDGETSLPVDNADGLLDRGWAAYLCVDSRESNMRADLTAKIDVNQSLLTELYDQVAEEFGEDTALFITAYRLYGATNVEPLSTSTTGSTSSAASGATTTGNAQTDAGIQQLASAMAKAITSGGEGTVTRGGLDLSQGASVEIASLYELVEAEVSADLDGASTTLTSPFGQDPESLSLLFDNFSTSSAETIDGRINVNEASEDVLLSIPDIPLDLPAAIIAARPAISDGAPPDEVLASRTNTGWILSEGLADLTTMRMIDQYITAGGTIFRMQAVGRFDGPAPTARVEAVIDATQSPARIVFRRDLSELGPGYRLDQLRPVTTAP